MSIENYTLIHIYRIDITLSINETFPVLWDWAWCPLNDSVTVEKNSLESVVVTAMQIPKTLQINGSSTFEFLVYNNGENAIHNLWLGFDIFSMNKFWQSSVTIDSSSIKVENTLTPMADTGPGGTGRKGQIKFKVKIYGDPNTYSQNDNQYYVPITLPPKTAATFTSDPYSFSTTNLIDPVTNQSISYNVGMLKYNMLVWHNGYPGESDASVVALEKFSDNYDDTVKNISDVNLIIVDGQPPASPQSLSGLGSNGDVLLQWQPSQSNDIKSYKIYRDSLLYAETNAELNVYRDENTVEGTAYTYKVTAYDYEDKESLPSSTITAKLNSTSSIVGTLSQYKSDGTTIIGVGGTTTENTVVFKAQVNDPDNDMVGMDIEVQPISTTAFTNIPTSSSGLAASGSTASVVVSGLANGSYHWQARARDENGGVSSWISFGGIDEAAADFIIGVTNNAVPTAPSKINQYTTSNTIISLGGTTNESSVVLKGFVSDPDGNDVKLEAEVRLISESFTGTSTHSSGFFSSGSNGELIIYPLNDGYYHWQVRVVDSNGSASGWAKFGNNAESEADFKVLFHVEQPPDNPKNIGQFKSDGTTLGLGQTVYSNTIILKADVSDPEGDLISLEAEVRPFNESYKGIPTHKSGLISGGTQISLSVNGLVSGAYHWRIRAVDSKGNKSLWMYIPTNGEHFNVVVDSNPPAQPTQLRQYTSGGNVPSGGIIATGYISIEGYVHDPDASDVKLEVELREQGIAFSGVATHSTNYFSTDTYPSIKISLKDGSYHWRARAVDITGSVSSWVTFGGNPDFIHQSSNDVITVCSSGCMYSDIKTAVSNSLAGDEVRVMQGTYYVGNMQMFNKQVTIKGGYRDSTFTDWDPKVYETFLSGHLSVQNGGNVKIEGFTIKEGSGQYGGAIYGVADDLGENLSLTIKNCVIRENTASTGGGIGILIAHGATGTILIENNTISNNKTTSGATMSL